MNDDLTTLLFNRSREPVAIYEPVDGGTGFVFRDVNAALERMEGVARAQLLGKRVTEVFPGIEANGLLAAIERVNMTGVAEHFKTRLRADGRIVGWRDNHVIKLNGQDRLAVVYDDKTDLRGLLDSVFGFIGVYSLDGLLIDANDAPLKAANLSRRDVIGKPFWDAYWWSHSQSTRDRIRDALERASNGETVRGEFEVRVGETETIFVDAAFGPLPNADGTIERLYGFGVDITRQRSADQAHQKTLARLVEAQRIAHIGSWELDHRSGDLFWSDEVFRIFEVDPLHFEMSYEAFLERVHPEDREGVDRAYTDSLSDQAPYAIKHRLLMPDGRIKWMEERGETDFDADGMPLVSRGTIQDVTELKELQDSRMDSEQLVRSFLENMPYCAALKDENGQYLYVNERGGVYPNIDRRQLIGKKAVDLFPPDIADLVDASEKHVVETGTASVSERVVDTEDGPRDFLVTKFPIVGNSSMPARFGMIAVDITDRKEAEKARLRDRARIHQLELDLARRQNITSMGFLLSALGHELRQPLQGLALYGQRLLTMSKGWTSPPEGVPDALAEIARLTGVAQQILGRIQNSMAPGYTMGRRCEISDIVRQAHSLIGPDLEVRGVRFKFTPPSTPTYVAVDPLEIQVILLNQIRNAYEALVQAGTANPTIEVRLGPTANKKIKISVIDNGPGIGEEQLETLFEFFSTTKTGGMGMGLAVCRHLARELGGELYVESTGPSGTVMCATLPAGIARPTAKAPTEQDA